MNILDPTLGGGEYLNVRELQIRIGYEAERPSCWSWQEVTNDGLPDKIRTQYYSGNQIKEVEIRGACKIFNCLTDLRERFCERCASVIGPSATVFCPLQLVITTCGTYEPKATFVSFILRSWMIGV